MEQEKKVCLIIPPSIFLLDERVFMSLGILKVAAVLEKFNYGVEVLDLSGIENFEDVVRDYVSSSDASFFGLTSSTPQLPAVVKIAKAIKVIRPDARIILGGSHVTLVNAARKNEEAKNYFGRARKSFLNLTSLFDVIVAGDGEKAIFEALKIDAPKIIDADNLRSELFLKSSELEDYPFPARHLLDVESYHYFIDGERALSLIAQLGCPYNCGFCGGRKSPALRVARMRSTKNIVEEVTLLYTKYGIKGFMFYDDELNLNPRIFVQLMNEISDLQESLGVKFKLRGFVRANLFNEEQAKIMYKAGFRWILVGFESGSEMMLKNMNKLVTLEENNRCLETARSCGLKVKALMSVGHPGESEDTMTETHKWLLKVKPDDFDVSIITVYPGTPYYDAAVPHQDKHGIWVYDYNNCRLYSEEIDYQTVADYYKGDPDGGYRSFVYTDFLTPEQFVKIRNHIEKDAREKLKIPFNPSSPAKRYEHSVGQGFPAYIVKKSKF